MSTVLVTGGQIDDPRVRAAQIKVASDPYNQIVSFFTIAGKRQADADAFIASLSDSDVSSAAVKTDQAAADFDTKLYAYRTGLG